MKQYWKPQKIHQHKKKKATLFEKSQKMIGRVPCRVQLCVTQRVLDANFTWFIHTQKIKSAKKKIAENSESENENDEQIGLVILSCPVPWINK